MSPLPQIKNEAVTRIIAILLSFATVLPSFVPAASLAQRLPPGTPGCPVTTAQPYRSPSVTTVFVVTPECKKRPIFNPEVYFSHFDDWNKVVFLEQYEMNAIPNHPLNFLPWGPRREFTNGSLVKTTDDARVYLVENGDAYPIESEQAFTSLGFSFNQIEDVDPAVLASFRKQSVAIKGPENIPPSTVFKYANDPKVYVLKQENGVQTKEYIPTYEALKAIARADRIVILPPVQTFPDKPAPTTFPVNPQPPVTKPDPKPVPTPDTTSPSVNFVTPDADATLSGAVTVIANATDNQGVAYVRFSVDAVVLKTDDIAPYEATLATTALTNGMHTLSAVARDLSGNVATTTRSITISNQTQSPAPTPTSTQDTTPPVVSFTLPAASASVNGTVSLQVDASDASGIASVQFKVDSSLLATDTSAPYTASLDTTTFANGVHTLTAIATDTKGNIETTTRSITVANVVTPPADTTAPTVAFTAPSNDGVTVSGALNIAVTASDSSGISAVRFKIGNTVLADDSDSPYGLALDTTAFTNGSYTLTAIAADPSGNQGTATRTIVISNVIVPPPDTSAPSVVMTSPASGSTVSGSITVSATASDDTGVSSVQFKAGSTVIGTDATSPFSVSFNTASVADGSLTLTAIASDAAGNQTTVTRSVTVSNVVVPPPDTTAPSVSFTAPAAAATVSGSVSITANAADNVGVTSVMFKVGSTVIATDTSSPYSATLDSTTLANGSATLTAVATDAAGNQGTATRSVTVSNVAPPTPDVTVPTVSFSSPANNATVNGAVTISASASDDVGVSSVQFKIGSTVIATDSSSPYSTSFDSTTLANGAYTLTVVATDAAGNQGTATRAITISNVAAPVLPAVKITIIGSSTPAGKNLTPAEGHGGTGIQFSWPNRLAAQLAIDRPGSTIVNLAVSGYSTFEALPTGTPTASGRPAVDPAKNITAAIATNPNAIIVSFANTSYPVAESIANFLTIHAAASAAGIPVWVSGPQPNVLDDSATVAMKQDFQNRLAAAFGSRAFNFLTPLALSNGAGNPALILDDNQHPNENGHLALYNVVYAANIPGNLTVQSATPPSSTPTPTPTPTSTPSALPISDNFNDNSLNTSIWTVSNPVGTVTETGGKLAFAVPTGSNGDWWTSNKNAPIASTALPSGDLEVTAKLETGNFILATHAGIALWTDRNNFYLFGRRRNGIDSRNGLTVDRVVNNGSGGSDLCVNSMTTLPAYLRIKRTGTTYDFQYSTDGSTWTLLCSESAFGFTPDKAGLFLKKWQTGTGDVTATFDDFSITAPSASPTPPPADVTAPTVSFTAPASGATVSGTATISANASDAVGVSSVQFKVGSTIIATDTTSPYSTTFDSTAFANGSATLSAVAVDAAGNVGTATQIVTISNGVAPSPDVTAPIVSFTAPSSGATLSGTATVTANASDAVGVSSVQFKVGSTIIATDTTSPYSATFDTTAYANGSVTLTAVAVDAAGNVGTATQNVTVSNTQSQPVQAALNCFTNNSGGSAMNLNLTTNRVTGVAPLSVFFDTAGTTSPASTNVFHDIAYCWDFGDVNAGGFFLTNNKTKNRAYGPVAAHVFETPGTYTVTVNARDAQGNVAGRTVQIVVTNPDTVYTNTTVCLSASGDFNGCPSGATQLTGASIGALSSQITSGKRRLLLRRGETFTGQLRIDAFGPGTVGAYGPSTGSFGMGNRPIVNPGGGPAFVFSDQDVAPTYPTDWRIMDIDVDGQSNGSSKGVTVEGKTANVLLLRFRANYTLGGVIAGDSIINYWNSKGNTGHDMIDGLTIVDSETSHAVNGGNLMYLAAYKLAIMGTQMHDSANGEHVLRTPFIGNGVIQNNNMGEPRTDKHIIKMHNSGFALSGITYQKYTERVVVSDNLFQANNEDWSMVVGPQNGMTDERVRDVLVERNQFLTVPGSAKPQVQLVIWAQDITVRDNIFKGVRRDCVSISRVGLEPPPARVKLIHNTCYSTGPETHLVAVGGKTEMHAMNNLIIGAQAAVDYSSGIANLTTNLNNLTFNTPQAAGIVSTSPTSAPTDFALVAGSGAISAGSALYATPWDFNSNPRAFGTGAPAPDVGAWDF